MPSSDYIEVLKQEIVQNAHLHTRPQKYIDTLYFGGGTPSLLPAEELIAVIRSLNACGFEIDPGKTEVTIEINPATVNEEKLKSYLDAGVNRFSVGAQTFDDRLLKMVKREHSAQQTRETLHLLQKYQLNFSFDILFALPEQTLQGVKKDLDEIAHFGASHISPYCLTVPQGHPLSKGRAPEEEQVEMFDLIWSELPRKGYLAYEISNFAKPGFESKHNLLYWTDQEYWGIGLSAHSYDKGSTWGMRYWNVNTIKEYVAQIHSQKEQSSKSLQDSLPKEQYELLEKHQSLTDFCHTSLRLMKGLDLEKVSVKFGASCRDLVDQSLWRALNSGLVQKNQSIYTLSQKGLVLSNQVFEEITFLRQDLP